MWRLSLERAVGGCGGSVVDILTYSSGGPTGCDGEDEGWEESAIVCVEACESPPPPHREPLPKGSVKQYHIFIKNLK